MIHDQLHTCLISLGSNSCKEQNIEMAIEALRPFFSSLILSERMYTDPIGEDAGQETFLNCVAWGQTTYGRDQIYTIFKEIERKQGRTNQTDKISLIPIDIDLICWDQQLLKPLDFKRIYIQKGLQAIQALLSDIEKALLNSHISHCDESEN